MDMKIGIEVVGGRLKIGGEFDDSGDLREFNREFKLAATPKRGIESDSLNYEVLANAVLKIKDVPGIVCEIGTRRGGSLKVIVDNLIKNEDFNRNIVCLDPYGNIDYFMGEKETDRPLKLDYTNTMRNQAMSAIYEYVEEKPVNVVFMCLEDTEFFKRYTDGVPFYNEFKTVEEKYALVFFDGPHTAEALDTELAFFDPRSAVGTVWVFDDTELYDHDSVEKQLFSLGWELIEQTPRKSSYVKK